MHSHKKSQGGEGGEGGEKDNQVMDIHIPNQTSKIAIVSIKDHGRGIDPTVMPRLFKKFISKSEQGTGLGLYLSKSIIEAHDGRIWAKNNEDGRGSTFEFSLPLTIKK